MKWVKLWSFLAKCGKVRKISPCEVCKFHIILYYVQICYHFWLSFYVTQFPHRLEAKKAGKESSSYWWDDDDDSDFYSSDGGSGSDSCDENIMRNTMLLTGPVGCGKTSAVYSCAEELGFKV